MATKSRVAYRDRAKENGVLAFVRGKTRGGARVMFVVAAGQRDWLGLPAQLPLSFGAE